LEGSGTLPDSFVTVNFAAIKALAKEVSDRGILFVMVLYPESPNFRNTPYFGRHGPAREAGRTIMAELSRSCSGIPNCQLYDANLEGNHDYVPEDFSDEDHLSLAGSIKISRRLDSLVYDAIGPKR
jgi:hypothetical protein